MNDALTPPMTRPLPYGLTYDELEFEPLTIEAAPDFDEALYDLWSISPTREEQARIYEAALALFSKQCTSTTYDFTDRAGLFAACLHTAIIWDRG